MQLEQSLAADWQHALAGDPDVQAQWQPVEGGGWSWQSDGVSDRAENMQWSCLAWQACNQPVLADLHNFVIAVTVAGKAEAAGLSFGPWKDFLASLDSPSRCRRLQLEVDAAAGYWAFRVDGQLMKRAWWDSGVHGVDDLINGVLSFKVRYGEHVLFKDLAIHAFEASCQLSVIMTCYRFLQRLRVSLRNWCHQVAPTGAYEILVVNPKSPDGTHEHLMAVSSSYPHVRIRELLVDSELATNKGAMINRAAQVCRGDWIWLTDADCLYAADSASRVLERIKKPGPHIFHGQRRFLAGDQTAALLSGRLDGVRDYDVLAHSTDGKPFEDAPWGFTQIVHSSTLKRIPYREDLNHFAQSDGSFITDCQRQNITPERIDGLFCLHMDHPFAWYGTPMFL